MDIRSVRSGALGVIAIARQFGVRITADAIESALTQDNIKKPKNLEKILAGLGVTRGSGVQNSKIFKTTFIITPALPSSKTARRGLS
jgi:hypothetical protein